jgi:hypothetical protein
MDRAALLVAFVSTGLLVPATSLACCSDIDASTPIGWSADGHLLVTRDVSSECNGTRVAEVLAPGLDRRERYDLFSASRPIGPDAEGRRLSDEAIYIAEEEQGPTRLFVPSRALLRRFSLPPRSLCRSDVLGIAEPSPEGPDAVDRSDLVALSVLVRTERGFQVVLRDVDQHRIAARGLEVFVHPSPDGRHALVRFHGDRSEALFDDLHWIDLPEDTVVRTECALDAASGYVLPSTHLSDDPYYVDDLPWLIESANEAFAAGEPERGSAAYHALEAAWTKPRDASVRALLVRALAITAGPDIAAIAAADAPLPPPGVPMLIEQGPSAAATAHRRASTETATAGRIPEDEIETYDLAPASPLELGVDPAAAPDGRVPPDASHASSGEPMSCSTTASPAALVSLLVPVFCLARRRVGPDRADRSSDGVDRAR